MKALAYFITWTTYGSWLPGDERGWVDRHDREIKAAQPYLVKYAQNIMKEDIVLFKPDEQKTIASTIHDTCKFKKWYIHALFVGVNHTHVVIGANTEPHQILKTLKNYCTRAMRRTERFRQKMKIWTKSGSIRYLNKQSDMDAAISYIENQTYKPPM